MRTRMLPIVFVVLVLTLLTVGVFYARSQLAGTGTVAQTAPSNTPVASPLSLASGSPASPLPSGSPIAAPSSNPNPDLAVDESGLSKATVTLNTTQGVIKFKFYPQDAPETTKRIIALLQQGFYNGLSWHRVVPGFVIQGGDPLGTGTGGSGKKLKAEFSNRRHVEGTVAMARGGDPDSADSQFYIALGTLPHLDHSYTVFGQVIEGLDAVRKIKVGDKIISAMVQ